MNQLCFSGEGKGRVIFLSERQSFSYESLLENENYTWSLGLEVPILGQEIFKLHYKNASNGTVLGQGNFYERLRKAAQKEKQSQYHLEVLDSYLKAVGRFLLFRKAVLEDRVKCSTGKCFFSDQEIQWKFEKASFLLEFPLSSEPNSEKFLLEAQEGQKGFYARLKMQMHDSRHRVEGRKPVEIDLTLNTCEQ